MLADPVPSRAGRVRPHAAGLPRCSLLGRPTRSTVWQPRCRPAGFRLAWLRLSQLCRPRAHAFAVASAPVACASASQRCRCRSGRGRAAGGAASSRASGRAACRRGRVRRRATAGPAVRGMHATRCMRCLMRGTPRPPRCRVRDGRSDRCCCCWSAQGRWWGGGCCCSGRGGASSGCCRCPRGTCCCSAAQVRAVPCRSVSGRCELGVLRRSVRCV